MQQLQDKSAPAQYTAILNSHGRHLHDLFLYRQPGTKEQLSVAHKALCPAVSCFQLQVILFPVDFWCCCSAEDKPVLLADVDKQGLNDLVKLLKKYANFLLLAAPDPHLQPCIVTPLSLVLQIQTEGQS